MKKKLITYAVQVAILSSIASTSTFALTAEEQAIESVARKAQQSTSTNEKTENKKVEKITVTGSRLRRDSFSVTTPISIMSRDEIQDTGLSSLSEILVDNMPSLNAGTSDTNSQSSVQNTGLSTIALRNLGTNRTLTLIDGRRVVSNSYSGNYVSLTSIPSGMVNSVEIITGGASATYGSDAISGVVNIITQTDKEGFFVKARGGESTEGGAKEFGLDFDYGTGFDNDRGYMYFSANWDRRFGLTAYDRPRAFISDSYSYRSSDMCNTMWTADGRQCMRDITQDDWVNLSDGTFGGVFLESSRNDTQFWYDENGLRDDWKDNEERYGIDFSQWTRLKVPNDSLVSAVKVDYELDDDMSAYFQVHYSRNNSANIGAPEDEYEGASALTIDPETGAPGSVKPGYIPIDNPYVPQEIIDSDPYRDRIYWDRRFAEVGNVTTDNTRTTVRTWAGLQGTAFDGDWDWDVSVGYGRFTQKQVRLNELNTLKVKKALNADYADDGVTIQCADAADRAEGCVPLNLFGIGSITPEAADYIRSNPVINTTIEQITALGYIAGDLFELPAGPVATVFGLEYRQDNQKLKTSDEQQYGGVTFNVVPAFDGKVEVYEAFAEAAFPLLRDVAGAKSLTAEVSVRVADYSMENVGMVASYKAGLTWEPLEGYAIRGNFARSQRAPTITELMSPPRGDYDSFTDLCVDTTATSTDKGHDNCRLDPSIAAVIAVDGLFEGDDNNYSPNTGNSELKEETGDTFTLGVTMAPSFIDGFRLAVDYYDITVTDAIAQIDNADILTGCYDSPTGAAWGSSNEHCNNITRNSDGEIIEILQRSYNLDELKSRGYDIAAEYNIDLDDFGRLKFKADFTHVIENSKSWNEDGVTQKNEYQGYLNQGIFEDKASASISWYKDDLRISWRTKFKSDVISSSSLEETYYEKLDENGNGGYFAENAAACTAGEDSCIENPEKPAFYDIASYITHSLSASYKLKVDGTKVRVFAGVNNIFDNRGPFILGGRGNYSSYYGAGVGRFVYLGAEASF